jgi:hypothetical protein
MDKMLSTPQNLWRRMAKLIKTIRSYQFIEGPLTYNQDGLATRHNCDFMADPLFAEAYRLGAATYQNSRLAYVKIHWRIHVLCWAASNAKNLDGDFVECGVNRGWFSRSVMHYIDFKNLKKKFYLLDTFNGFVDKYLLEEEKRPGLNRKYEECYEDVKATFMEFPNVELVRGAVPDTLPRVKAEKVCYLSIDMNSVLPEIASAEFFWEKMVSGAYIVLDDYGWAGHHLQKQAFDEFASKRGVTILSLPTGQGLIVKP